MGAVGLSDRPGLVDIQMRMKLLRGLAKHEPAVRPSLGGRSSTNAPSPEADTDGALRPLPDSPDLVERSSRCCTKECYKMQDETWVDFLRSQLAKWSHDEQQQWLFTVVKTLRKQDRF